MINIGKSMWYSVWDLIDAHNWARLTIKTESIIFREVYEQTRNELSAHLRAQVWLLISLQIKEGIGDD